MTKRKAIEVLIDHAVQNCKGVGCGIRTLPSPGEQDLVAQAIQKVWPNSYPIPWHNLGFQTPEWARNE